LITTSLGPGSGIGLSLISTLGPAATIASFILYVVEVLKPDRLNAVVEFFRGRSDEYLEQKFRCTVCGRDLFANVARGEKVDMT